MRRYLVIFIPVLFLTAQIRAQLTITHGKAERVAVTNLRIQASLPKIYKRRHFEIEEEHHPRHMRLPPGSHVKKEDSTLAKRHPSRINSLITSPAPSANFQGVVDNQELAPPDVQGAAGINYVMTTLNSQYQIMTRAGAIMSTIDAANFWPTAWWSTDPNAFFSDPRIQYDPYANRWIVITLFLDDNGTLVDNGKVFVAVSETDDPTGMWYDYEITVDATNASWADYPYVGFSNKWIIITGNMEPVSDDNFYPNKIWVLDKANYYSGGTGNFTTIVDNTVSQYIEDTVGTAPSMVPAVTFDSTLAVHYMVQTWDASQGLIKLSKITGPVGDETLVTVSYIQSAANWSSEALGAHGGGFFDQIGPQKGSKTLISCNYDDMQGLVYRNGVLWGVQGVFLPANNATRASIQWWNFDTTGTVVQRARIDDATGHNYYAFPSISVNSQNDALIGYTIFNKAQYPAAAYSYRSNCDSLNTFDSSYIYKAGDTIYFKTWDSNTRWGDETQTVVDPVDDVTLWTLGEYAAPLVFDPTENAAEGTWATWFAQVSPGVIVDGGPGTWTWTGDMDNNWFNRCNWDKGTLPNIQSDVVIPGGTGNNPTITGTTANCNTLQVNTTAGGILTIDMPSGGLLWVNQ